MAEIIIRKNDGQEIVVREVSDKIRPYDVLIRSDYVATKLWCREDIEIALELMGEDPSEELVDKVLKYDFRFLEDCSEDWETIENALEFILDDIRK